MTAKKREAKIAEARELLRTIGMPEQQCNELSGLVLLALAGVRPTDDWAHASDPRLGVVKDIMAFIGEAYKKQYAENSRETVRRGVVHQFFAAGLVQRNPDDPDLPTNSPRTHYALSHEAVVLIRNFQSDNWEATLRAYLKKWPRLVEQYYGKGRNGVPLRLPSGEIYVLSAGSHNELEKGVVEEFAPRFAPGGELLYLGDTANKMLIAHTDRLAALGVPHDKHGKLPDVVLYHEPTNRLFLVEAVTSHGPVSPLRLSQLEQILGESPATRVYVSAFPDFAEFKKHASAIAWETEVWLADMPDHLIHYNGDKFLPTRTPG